MADTQPFDFKQPIVDPATGLPTQYFLDMLYGSGKIVDGKAGEGDVTASGLTMATSRLLGRATAEEGVIEELTLSEALDLVGSPGWGDILFRSENGWSRLAAGTSGRFLKTLGAGVDPEWAVVSSGGASWSEILTHDFVANPQSTLEIDISGFGEIKLIGEGVDHAASVYRAFQLSTDGGSTWFNTSGDYQEIANTGVPANAACIVCHSTASSAARTFYGILNLFGGLAHASYRDENLARNVRFAGSASAPDTLLFGGFSLATSTTPSASNFDAGVLTVLGR